MLIKYGDDILAFYVKVFFRKSNYTDYLQSWNSYSE